MARNIDLPLSELSDTTDGEGFARAWARFELVAAAQEWSTEKQLVVLPTLLRGKLVDFYMELDEDIKGDLKMLRETLAKRAGFQPDPLTAAKEFMACSQRHGERVEDFASRLKKLCRQAFAEGDANSGVVLQRLITGLLPSVGRQVLIKGKPDSLERAIEVASRIKYALQFQVKRVHFEQPDYEESPSDCFHVSDKQQGPALGQTRTGLQDTLERRLENLEASTKRQDTTRRPPRRNDRKCWKCGKEGHFQYRCPLNDTRPAQ